MARGTYLIVVACLSLPATASAQGDGWRFRWQKGQALAYQAEHVTTASETVAGTKTETTTTLRHVKLWQVLDVDASGVATLQMSLKSLRFELDSPRAKLAFDSAEPGKSDPQLREQMGRYVGQPLAVLRIDPYGRVVEVKESRHGPATRFEAELPFTLVLPAAAPKPGQSWERNYQITLEPPQGTGEKHAATQRFVCQEVKGTTATLTFATTLKQPPEAAADQIPLFQMLPEGVVEFDTAAGCLQSATLKIEKDLTNHQGEGSSYRFRSRYVEKRVAATCTLVPTLRVGTHVQPLRGAWGRG